MTTDLAPVLLALQTATGIRVIHGQITLHIADGTVAKVETTDVQRVSKRGNGEPVDKSRATSA